MQQQPDQKLQEQKENQNQQQMQESELQAANAELRERFLRFLSAIPGRAVEAKMFGGNLPVKGVISAVDAVDFNHLLVDKLRTPMGVIEHAALRTNDTVFLRIPWKLEEGNVTAKEIEGKEQKVEKGCKNDEKEEEKRNENVQKAESNRPGTARQNQSTIGMAQQIEPTKFATIFDEVAGAEEFQKAKEEEEKIEVAIEEEEKPTKMMDEEKGKIEEEKGKIEEEGTTEMEEKMDEEKIESKMDDENMEKMDAEMQMDEAESAVSAIDNSNLDNASAANFAISSTANPTQIPISTDVNLASISQSEPIAASSTTTTSGLSSALTSPRCDVPTPTKMDPVDPGGNYGQQKKRRNKPTVGSRMGAMGKRVVQMQFASGDEFFDHFDRQQQKREK